ncbi:MAG: NAD(P)-dependent oxidoreductase [Coriobacteriia bacterium]|nr:NAD(P)-dependent oxidoreductase [Coriobacteriia bacterium]
MAANLVTGGFGFVGSYVVRHLVGQGEKVVVYDVSANNRLVNDIADRYEAVQGDLSDWPRLMAAVGQHLIDCIFHVAAMVAPQTEDSLYSAFRANVGGMVNLLEACRLLGVPKLVYASSTGVYGDGLGTPPIVDEDSPQFPWHMYGTTKVCCERLGEQYRRTHGIDFRGLRLPPVLGAARNSLGHTAFCDRVLRETLKGKPYKVYVDPATPIVSAMSVQDAAKALVDLRNADGQRLTRRIYVIDSLSFTAGELVDEVRRRVPGAAIDFDPDQSISASLRKWPVPNTDRARIDWGWQPIHGTVAAHVDNFVTEYRADPSRFA